MITISKYIFLRDFMEISRKLTLTELRMLYVLMIEPEAIELSQQEFAEKVDSHRRTINIGLKKLKELGFVKELHFSDLENNTRDFTKEQGTTIISPLIEKQASKFIVDAVRDYYYPFNKDQLKINEDFFSSILGDHRLNENFRFDRTFIIETIRDYYADVRFHFELKKADYNNEDEYRICRKINKEIADARTYRRYSINKDKLEEFLLEKYAIEEDELMRILKQEFKKLTIYKNRIRIPKPWKMSAITK